MIGPESSLHRVDRHQRRAGRILGIRLNHQIFVEHRRRQIGGPALEHLLREEAGGFAIVDNGQLDGMDEALGLLGIEIFGRQTARLARTGISFGEDRE